MAATVAAVKPGVRHLIYINELIHSLYFAFVFQLHYYHYHSYCKKICEQKEKLMSENKFLIKRRAVQGI